jgi:predicted molibdopterin-dependent oxidoreductase YjgC
MTGQFLFHSGSLSTWDEGLRLAAPIPFVQVHPEDAQKRGLTDGDTALVESPHGSLKLAVKVTEKVPRGAVFVPVNFPEAPANVLQSADAPVDYVRIVKA